MIKTLPIKRQQVLTLFLVTLFILLPGAVHESQAVSLEAEVDVDWDAGVIFVEGFGVPPEDADGDQARLLAQRAAKADAYRNAAEYLDGVNVTSRTKVEEYMVKDDVIETRVEGFIEGARVVTREFEDDASRVEIALPLEKEEESLTGFFETNAREDVEEAPEADRDEYEEVIDEVIEEEERERIDREEYTGVIIDTRGLNVETALYPQVFDTEGNLLYGPTTVGIEEPGSASTLVAYARSMEKAREMERVGDNPYILEATSVVDGVDQAPVDIVINEENSGRFLEMDDNTGIIDDRAVVFVID